MEYAVSEELAIQELESIENEFQRADESYRDNLILAIQKGQLEFDSQKKEILYRLNSPVENGGSMLTEIRFQEPNVFQLREIAKTSEMETDKSMKFKVSMEKMAVDKVLGVLTHICGVPNGVAFKIKAKDYKVIEGIADFLS
jgi:hypothetical protein